MIPKPLPPPPSGRAPAARSLSCPGLFWWVIVLMIVTAVPAVCQEEGEATEKKSRQKAEETQTPSRPSLVDCPRCEASGRVLCPDCRGKGQFFRPCKLCDGKGERPCSQCSEAKHGRGQAELTPGRVKCPECGGKGTVGKRRPKICARCTGEQVIPCPSCLGKATRGCKKEVFDRICGLCGLSGKLKCPVCKGARRVSPQVAASAVEALKLASHSPGHHRSARTSGRSERTSGETTDAVEVESRSLEERFRRLEELHREGRSLKSGEILGSLRAIQGDSSSLSRKLSPYGRVGGERISRVTEKLADHRGKATRLRASLDRAVRSLEMFERSFRPCETVWKRAQNRSEKMDRDEQKDWEKDMRLTLRICERRAGLLADLRLASFLEESGSLQSSWKALVTEVDELIPELEKIAAEAKGKEREARQAAAVASRSPSRRPRSSREPVRIQPLHVQPAQTEGTPSRRDDATATAVAASVFDREGLDEDLHELQGILDRPPTATNWLLATILWLLAAALLVAAGAPLVRQRLRSDLD